METATRRRGRGKVERLRVALVVVAAALVVGVAGWIGYARYRAAKSWLSRLPKGATLERETDGFTYSQSVQGKTIFTLHASKAFQHKDGKWTLHDVVLTLYGLHGDRADRVYGDTFEWDDSEGVARAVGEVQMDLQVPPGVASAERHGGESAATASAGGVDSVHVRTSGLVFVRQLGVAATDQQIEFRYGGIVCTGKGAEFDQGPNALHLLGEVHAEGDVRGRHAVLTASKADFRRDTNVLSLDAVKMTSDDKAATADAAVVSMRQDGSVERMQMTGSVVLSAGGAAKAAAGRRARVEAARMDAGFNAKSQPLNATLTGGVRWSSAAAAAAGTASAAGSAGMQGTARQVAVSFDAKTQPTLVEASGAVHAVSVGNVAEERRALDGDDVRARFAADARGRAGLREVVATGHARVESSGVRTASGAVTGAAARLVMTATVMQADALRAEVSGAAAAKGVRDGPLRVDVVYANGNASVEERSSDGAERSSTAERMEVHLRPLAAGAGEEIATADESGNVQVRSHRAMGAGSSAGSGTKAGGDGETAGVMRASAATAHYDADGDVLALAGGAQGPAQIDGDGRTVLAEAVRYHRTSGNAEAQGHVRATLEGQNGPSDGAAAAATHVTAERAMFVQSGGGVTGRDPGGVGLGTVARSGAQPAARAGASGVRTNAARPGGMAKFYGGAGTPARLFQGASQVEAAEIDLDGQSATLTAKAGATDGWVDSVFAGSPAAKDATAMKDAAGGRQAGGAAGSGGKSGNGGAPGNRPIASGAVQVLRVRSRSLVYTDASQRAEFAGPVTMRASDGILHGDRAEAFFIPNARGVAMGTAAGTSTGAATGTAVRTNVGPGLGGAGLGSSGVDRVVVSGNVQVTEPGREATGAQMVYRAADGSFILTGTPAAPPHVHDAAQGDVTGTSLLLRPGDTTIVVSGAGEAGNGSIGTGGAAAGGKEKPVRARIDTRVRQKAQ